MGPSNSATQDSLDPTIWVTKNGGKLMPNFFKYINKTFRIILKLSSWTNVIKLAFFVLIAVILLKRSVICLRSFYSHISSFDKTFG
jgi:hypothetical protein